jgi:hypothetical protein
MPSFGAGAEYNPLNKHVNSTDVMIGAGIGVAGGGVVMYAVKKFWPTAPSFVMGNLGAISIVGAGLAAHMLFRKKSKSRAEGYLVGAATVAIIPALWTNVKPMLPATVQQYFGDPVIAMPSYGGFLTRSPQPLMGYRGLLTASPGPAMSSMSPARRAIGLR